MAAADPFLPLAQCYAVDQVGKPRDAAAPGMTGRKDLSPLSRRPELQEDCSAERMSTHYRYDMQSARWKRAEQSFHRFGVIEPGIPLITVQNGDLPVMVRGHIRSGACG